MDVNESCMAYLRQEGARLRAQQAAEQEFADRLGITVERLRALLAASVRHPGLRWSL